jgi:NADH dehydrogenase
MQALDVVTGAFGFSGKYISQRLLNMGRGVRTLTNHAPSQHDSRIEAVPLDFSDLPALTRRLEGAKVLYNSYWIRFGRGERTHELAVANSKKLIQAAEAAGVERLVHVSITNPSLESPLPYFSGKAEVEAAIRGSKLSYAILRPAVLFGDEDILINNIAWMLRRLPVFAIPGDGKYRLQPIFVEDLATLAVEQGQQRENAVLNAVGPETFSYDELVRLIREVVRSRSGLVHVAPQLVLMGAAALGWLLRDVVLTQDEIRGLMADLLFVGSEATAPLPAGATKLSTWLRDHATTAGTKYASELARHY